MLRGGLPRRRHNYVAGAGQTPSSIAAIERALGAVINDDPYDRETSVTPGRSYRSDVKDGGVSAELNYDFGRAQLTSITAYRTNKFVGGGDVDYNNLDIFFRADDGGYGAKFKTFTQELRLQGTTMNDRLDWLVGAFYANEDLTRRDNTSIGADADRYFGSLVRASSPALAAFPGLQSAQSVRAGLRPQPADDQPAARGRSGRGLSAGDQRDCRPGREHPAGEPDHAATFSGRRATITRSSPTTSSRSPTSSR